MSSDNNGESMDVEPETPSASSPSKAVKMETGEQVEYRLSRIFPAHKQDVKCVLGTPMGAIVTASRDERLKIWTERGGAYCETACLHPAERMAVNSAAFYQRPDADGGQWYLFTGLKNGHIHVYEGAAAQPLAVLREHSSNVCVLHVDAQRKVLLSGSWDSRALAWPIDEIISGAMKEGSEGSCWELTPRHTHSVWALASVPGGYLTGSADMKIMLHSAEGSQQSNKALTVFAGHKDVVRALVVVSSHYFISAANDSTVRLWSIAGGQCLQVMNSTGGEYLYALAPIYAGHYVVSAGEGGHFDLWKVERGGASSEDSEEPKNAVAPQLTLHQSLRLPAQSIWSVAESARNGDVALATSTGQVYIYSNNKARWASDELLQSFDAEFTAILAKEIEAQMNSEQDTVTINVALDDGQPTLKLEYVKGSNLAIAAEEFIKANNLPISYLNEITDYIKANVPEARLAEAINHRHQPQTTSDGEETFDHSMEVSLTKEGPPLQLGFNLGEQPELAAQRFLEKHKLPVKFLPNLSALVAQQMTELQFGAGSDYVDPLTGGGRYVPGGGNSSSNGHPTGSARAVKSVHLPLADYFLFPVAENASTTTKALAKLHEMNSLQVDELRLEEAELTAVEEIMTTKEFYATEAHLIALEKGAMNWPIDTILPLMDAFRLALLNKQVNEHFCGAKERATETLQRLSVLLISDPAAPLKVFICRALTNAFAHDAGKAMIMSDVNAMSKLLSQQIGDGAKPLVETAAASALANVALALYRQSESGKVAELGPREDALRAIIARLESLEGYGGGMSAAAIARLLQAIGTLMWGDGSVVALARGKELGKHLPRIKDSFSESDVKELCNDISAMLMGV